MPVDRYLEPWAGSAFRHISVRSGYDILDFSFAGRGADNRWSAFGQPTLYLAGDFGVPAAEWARHYSNVSRASVVLPSATNRVVFGLNLMIERVVDLRRREVLEALSVRSAPVSFLEIGFARLVANRVRNESGAQAMIVPSMSFLDQPERWCLVLFLEKLPEDSREYIIAVEPRGFLRMGDIVEQ
jgi:hypothetical protein